MTRVLQVVPYLHPRAGGPPIVVNQHSTHLAARGWGVSVVTTDLFCKGDERKLGSGLPEGVELSVLSADRPRWRGLGSRGRAILEAEVDRADLVHVHGLWHALTPRVRRLCHRHGKPYVMMPHGMLDPYSLGVRRFRKALYLALVEGRNLRWAARTIYTTEEERELAEGEVRALAPAAIVPLGSDAPRGRDPALLREGFLRRFPPASDRRCVLFLSRIHPKKGLDRLLDVMPRLIDQRPDLLLLVVGSGEGDHMDSVKRQIDHLGLGESVLLCGHLTGDLKWGAYAVAELFVLPSRQENFGLVVAEAMQMRLPVVVSNRVNSCCYVAQSQAGVICDCDDSGALYGAVASLLDDPTTAAAMGARGHSFATAKLTWEASTDRLESCYSEVLQDR